MSDSEQIVFFVDRALGKIHVPDALRNVGEAVEIHDDHFSQNALDTDWLPIVAVRGWVVLTADKKIGHRHLEMLAVEQSLARVFVLVSGNITGPDMARIFVDAINPIKRFLLLNEGPFIAKVYRYGRVQPWRS